MYIHKYTNTVDSVSLEDPNMKPTCSTQVLWEEDSQQSSMWCA